MHNCCVDWARRIVKYNVNKGSIACKSQLYEGDCDCRISSTNIFNLFGYFLSWNQSLNHMSKNFIQRHSSELWLINYLHI